MDFNEWLVGFTGELSGFLYTYILLLLLVVVGVYFTIRTKAVQLRYLKDMFSQLTEKKHVQGERSISSFQALMVSTASRVGTGNIAGVATAIATGGPGAVFWMGLMAIIGAASAFVESTLAQIWKVRGKDGRVPRRPGLLHRAGARASAGWASCSPCCSSCASRSASTGCRPSTPPRRSSTTSPTTPRTARPSPCGIVLAVMTAFVIFGGAKRISVITSIIVPIMAVGYIGIAVWTTLANIRELPDVFGMVLCLGVRLPGDLRRLRGLGGHAGHQARPVLQRGRHGLRAERGRHGERVAPLQAGPRAEPVRVHRHAAHLHVLGHDGARVLRAGPRGRRRAQRHAARADGA